MEQIKIIIEIEGGALQAVFSNADIMYVLIDHDNIEAGDPPTCEPMRPEAVNPHLFNLYDPSSSPTIAEIRKELMRIKF